MRQRHGWQSVLQELTDLGRSTVSSTCSMASQAMKSVNVTVAGLPPVGVMVSGFRPTCKTHDPILFGALFETESQVLSIYARATVGQWAA